MNEYKGTPYACMRAHGYPCVRMRFDGHPLHSESERDIVNLTFSQFLSIFRLP